MFLHFRKVVDYLHGIDIARLQGVDISTEAFVIQSEVWCTIIRRELPQLEVADDMWCDLQLTPLIVKCFGFLSHSVISATCVVSITNATDLERLEACLRKAATIKTSHVASGGRTAYVLVGDFHLATHANGTMFAFNSDEADVFGGLPAGGLELKVSVTRQGSIFVGAKYHADDRSSRVAVGEEVVFAANFHSVDSELKVSFRQGYVGIDGAMRQVLHGICPFSPVHGTSLCIASLTDGPPNGYTQFAAALTMDAPSNCR